MDRLRIWIKEPDGLNEIEKLGSNILRYFDEKMSFGSMIVMCLKVSFWV